MVLLDLYGPLGKPWNINVLEKLLEFPDVVYWWMMYIKLYNRQYRHFKNDMLKTLYENIVKTMNNKNQQ